MQSARFVGQSLPASDLYIKGVENGSVILEGPLSDAVGVKEEKVTWKISKEAGLIYFNYELGLWVLVDLKGMNNLQSHFIEYVLNSLPAVDNIINSLESRPSTHNTRLIFRIKYLMKHRVQYKDRDGLYDELRMGDPWLPNEKNQDRLKKMGFL